MVSLTWWTWLWVGSSSCWWTGKHGVLQSMGSQRVRHDWVTELIWTECSGHKADQVKQTFCGVRSVIRFFLFTYLFMSTLGLCCCMWAFSSWSEWGLLSSCDVQASYCCGLSCCGAWALGRMGSVVVVFILYHILIINTIRFKSVIFYLFSICPICSSFLFFCLLFGWTECFFIFPFYLPGWLKSSNS